MKFVQCVSSCREGESCSTLVLVLMVKLGVSAPMHVHIGTSGKSMFLLIVPLSIGLGLPSYLHHICCAVQYEQVVHFVDCCVWEGKGMSVLHAHCLHIRVVGHSGENKT
jgi:hypothetical protein